MPYAFQINFGNSQSNLFYLWSDKYIVQEEKYILLMLVLQNLNLIN